ncbi:gp53-like domain-containing protein, partial [Shewanella sp.]|uniref:gp53-like domain-containing protein n=1 Tax=Shewanella sp. TaxID=50422 RepID=UPI003F3D213E
NGLNGGRGAGMYKVATASGTWATGDSATDAAAAGACPGGAVAGDTVTVYKSTDVSVALTKQWNGSAWVVPAIALHGGMVVDGSITTRALAAGAVTAEKLSVSSLINTTGVYTSFKIQPASNQPLWLGNTDSAGNNPVPTFYIDRAGLGYFKGGLGANTVDADAINQAAKTQINPYFLGAQAGSKQENTTSAGMASVATVSLPAVTVIGGIVNVSAALAANSSNFSTNRLGAVNPQWQVEIFRTSTAGTRVFNQTFTGTSWSLYDGEAGSPSFGFWDESESISINIAFTDSSAPASTVYVMRVTKIAGVMVTSLNRSYFGANSPSYVTNTLQKAANGYFKDKETGFIIQWGSLSLAANAVSTVTLPVAFTALCTFASANQLENNAAADPSLVYAKTLTTISVINGANSTQTVLWCAMGY